MDENLNKKLEAIENGERDWSMFTDRQRSFLLALDDMGGNITAACIKANIKSRQTIYNWMKDEAFKAEVDYVNESSIDYVESKLMTLIQQDNPQAIMFYLKTKGRKRGYVETIENQVSVNQFEELMRKIPDDE
jgi:hypothetical protein